MGQLDREEGYARIRRSLEVALRRALEHDAHHVVPNITEALKHVSGDLKDAQNGASQSAEVSLHLALESCFHLANSLELDEVSRLLQNAMSAMRDVHGDIDPRGSEENPGGRDNVIHFSNPVNTGPD